MIIDCGRCTVRGVACENCAVTFVTGPAAGPATRPATPPATRPAGAPVPPGKARGNTTGKPASAGNREPVIELDAAEIRALTALANAGLIPPLRYAPSMAKAS